MTERPHNVRSTRIIERGYPSAGHNSRRPMSAVRTEDNQIANRSAKGSHRTDEHTPAEQRSSRVGRRHVDRQDDASNRW